MVPLIALLQNTSSMWYNLGFRKWGGGGGGGGPTLFLYVDFVNILPKKGGGQTLMSTKALKKC